jgi:hypothetical protein
MRSLLLISALQLMTGWAHACLFARDAQPQDWYEWASALFAGDVTNVEQDAQKSLDVITVRVVETFKGPQGAVATLQVPHRMWTSCRLELPAVGARVLVALNPNSDTLFVPLTAAYTEALRQRRPGSQPGPAVKTAPPTKGDY